VSSAATVAPASSFISKKRRAAIKLRAAQSKAAREAFEKSMAWEDEQKAASSQVATKPAETPEVAPAQAASVQLADPRTAKRK
jgi:hypothetical protein